MDKKLLIALLLTAIVVAVTPILFPTPKRSATSSAAAVKATVSDSLHPQASSIVQADTGSAPAIKAAPVNSVQADSVSSIPAVVPQITEVNSARSTYRFSNIGAAPVSIVMKNYKNLSPVKGLVDLKVHNQALLRYSLILAGDTIPLDRVAFSVSEQPAASGDRVLTYRTVVKNVGLAIAYDVTPDRYVAHISGRVENAPPSTFLLIDLPSSLPTTEADTLSDMRTLSYSFKQTRSNAHGVPFGKLDPGEKRLEPGPLGWAAVRNKYFVIGLVNPEGSTFDEMTLTGGPRTTKLATNASAVIVKSIKTGTFAFDLYAGPQQADQLLAMGRDFDHVNPYGWSFLQPVVNPIAAVCIRLLLWIHDHVNLSYGWVLILFGVFIRVALWPLNQSAMRSSLKMQEIQPKLAEVQKKYKDKPEQQREAMMKVYKEAGASPFTALSGCLPMLIPMPVLFALFFVFQNTIEFRGVPFLWLTDISVKDHLYILPVLMGISMYLMSWMGLRNAPPNPQAKMMSYMFPVMMTFVLANMASGLNLYYTAQNIASLPQQWLLAKERQRARRSG
jgi:YidC/Oxa1 family membrane protein insertase